MCLVSLPLGIFGVIGFEGDSLSEFAVNWVRWLIHRRTLYRSDTPVPEAPEKPMKAVSGMSAPKPPEQLGIKIKENPKKRKKRKPVKKPHKASKHKSSVAKKSSLSTQRTSSRSEISETALSRLQMVAISV